MKLIVAPEAQEELREIESYIGKDNPKAAVEFVGRLTERYQALTDFPGMGRKRDDVRSGYRSIAEGDYLIFYRVSDDVVEVMHVLHGRRNLQRIFEQE